MKAMAVHLYAAGLTCTLVLLLGLFTGVERFTREHGEVHYDLFVKQAPGFIWMYENKAQCGACDLRPWSLMRQSDLAEFAD